MKKLRKILPYIFILMLISALAACSGGEEEAVVLELPTLFPAELETIAPTVQDEEDIVQIGGDALSGVDPNAGGGGLGLPAGGDSGSAAGDPNAGGMNPSNLPSTGRSLDYCESAEAAETLADGRGNTMTTPDGEIITLCSLRHQAYVAESFEKNPDMGNPNPPVDYCQNMPADVDPALRELCSDTGGG